MRAVDLFGLAGRLKKHVSPGELRQRGLRGEAWLSRGQHYVPEKRALAFVKAFSSHGSLPALIS